MSRGSRSSCSEATVCRRARTVALPLFYDAPPVLFPRLSETKLLASTTHWPHAYLLLRHSEIETYFSVRRPRKTSATALRTRTNKPAAVGRLNHGTIYSGTGLRRGEQDGSRCQHEFASLVCLSGASAEKTPLSHCVRCSGRGQGAGAARLASVIRRCGRLTRLSVVSNETLFFPFPCFPTLRLLHVFFWIGNGIRQTKNWQKYGRLRWKIVVFAIGSVGSRVRWIDNFIYKIVFFVCHVFFVFLIVFLHTKIHGGVTLNIVVPTRLFCIRWKFRTEGDKNRVT